MRGSVRRWAAAFAALTTGVALLLAAGGGAQDPGRGPHEPGRGPASSPAVQRAAFERYVVRVEPLRRTVNRLLEGADPILGGRGDRPPPVHTAVRRMDRLERRFAAAGRSVAAIRTGWPALEHLHRTYAGTYPLEDAYLRALAAAIPRRSFAGLPHTEVRQRRALVAWRVGVESLARRLGVRLPGDVRVAGRGEIAPAPDGS